MTINGTDFLAPDLAALLERTDSAASTTAVTSAGAALRARRRVFPGHPAQVAHARRFVQRSLAPDGPAADAALLTSELATNAVWHTASGQGGTFEVIIWQCPSPSASRRRRRFSVHPCTCLASRPDLIRPRARPRRRPGLPMGPAHRPARQNGRTVWFELPAS